jgi:hypothetical protein
MSYCYVNAVMALPTSRYAAVNLRMLEILLNFTTAQRAWLRVAYHLGSDGSGPTAVVASRDDALHKLAGFLNIEFAELVASTFPNRLCALQLLTLWHLGFFEQIF